MTTANLKSHCLDDKELLRQQNARTQLDVNLAAANGALAARGLRLAKAESRFEHFVKLVFSGDTANGAGLLRASGAGIDRGVWSYEHFPTECVKYLLGLARTLSRPVA